ncbi:MAG: hypothetical protein WCD19_08175 [Nitrososphaeraceae archaeon]
MSEALPTDMNTLTELMRKPIIIRIVSILDVTSLSILELLEYGLTLNDVNYSMTNRVICYEEPRLVLVAEDYSGLGIGQTPDYYYNSLRSKVKLTEIGLYILESIKGEQSRDKSSKTPEHQPYDIDPRHVGGVR